MPKRLAAFVLAIAVSALPGVAQTTGELLQRGIFAQETEGNLDNAIMIYRQIVNSAPSQRELAAQAQYRLAQALLQKGDLTNASAEFNRLARDYADYQKLISALAAQAGRGGPQITDARLRDAENKLKEAALAAGAGGRSGGPGLPPALAALNAMSFDENRPVIVRGKVTSVTFMNPVGMIMVEMDNGDRYAFATAAANQMLAAGFNRTTLKLGEEVTVTGVLSKSDEKVERRTAARADRISTSDGRLIFNRGTLPAAAPAQAELATQKAELARVVANIATAETQLSILRQQYQEDHPEVRQLRVQIEALKRMRQEQMQFLERDIANGDRH